MNDIEARSLTKEFKGGVLAVAGVDLEVKRGEVFGFLGPNGAGKTTTVRMLTTLVRPTAGEATVAGFDLLRRPHDVRRSIGVALQEAGLDPVSTGRELLQLQAELFGMSAGEAKRRAIELLELIGLSEAADRQVRTYSGGMKRRLDLASALVHGPKLLFLDEPTEGLDPASRATVWQEVSRLNREFGVTVFLTTHYLEEADRLADRIAIIDQGRIVAEGTPSTLKGSVGGGVVTVNLRHQDIAAAQEALLRLGGVREIRTETSSLVLFVEEGAGILPGVIRILDAEGIDVGGVAVSEPTLDEVFLRATGSRLEGAEQEPEEVAV